MNNEQSTIQKFACVAGGTSGIGKQAVLVLLQRGYNVIAIGRQEQHAHELEQEAKVSHNGALFIEIADAREIIAVELIAEKFKTKFGKLDLLVNSAGTISSGGLEKESFATWETVITTNLHSMFTLSKAFLPLLKNGDSPSIVNVSSVCSIRPCTSLSYSVSKAGTDMFTKVLAKELAQYGIRVNSVNPGVVRSNLQYSAGLFDKEEAYEQWAEQMKQFHPLGRIGEPLDVVNAILFLSSKEASWITGAILSVDGGRAIA